MCFNNIVDIGPLDTPPFAIGGLGTGRLSFCGGENMITLYPLDAEQPEALRGEKLQRILRLMDSPRQVKFYQSPEWMRIRRLVLERHNNECEICRSRGKYARATMVHHVWYVTKHPELSLSEHYYSGGKAHAQLMALCHSCHEAVHQHRHAETREPITPERW